MAVLFALLFAVTYWSTIPLGYMADIDQDGFKVIICDSQGPVCTLTIGADGEPIDEHDRATGNGGPSHPMNSLQKTVRKYLHK